MQDVNPDALPASADDAANAGRWLASSTDGANINRPARGSLPEAIGLVSYTEFDEQGRPRKRVVQTPSTLDVDDVSYTVYEANRMIVFPKWDPVNHAPLLPFAVTETDDGGRVLRRYTVRTDVVLVTKDPSTHEPIGLNALTQDDYVTLMTYVYDAVTGQQAQARRYHDIPSSGDGVLGTHYDATIVKYDLLGRRETTIQTVSGTDPANGKEQVTQVVYENGFLGRVVETRSGVSDANHPMGADYDMLPTLYTRGPGGLRPRGCG